MQRVVPSSPVFHIAIVVFDPLPSTQRDGWNGIQDYIIEGRSEINIGRNEQMDHSWG